jgi:16S rRNA (uracil1498-N3)-methyltransferase
LGIATLGPRTLRAATAAIAAVVGGVDRAGAELTVVAPSERPAESPLSITLAVGLAKGAKIDWIVEKTTELGVARIVPFTSERAVPDAARSASKLERWRRIAAAAAAQSGRAVCPVIEEASSYAALLERAAAHERAVLFWEESRERLRTALPATPKSVMVVTGPEGGFSADEAAAAARAGFGIATLGPRTLRAETAAIAAVVVAQLAWGDLLTAPGAW